MKSAIMFLFLVSCVYAQDEKGNSPFSILPEQPTIGSTINVTYRSGAPGAQLTDVDAVELFTLVFRQGDDPKFIDTPMKKEGGNWVGSFQLTEKNSSLMIFRCVSAGKADEGGEKGADAMVYGGDGKPVMGAHSARAFFMINGQINSFKRTKDLAGAKEEIKREKDFYPQNWRAANLNLGMISREDPTPEGKAALKSEVEKFAAAFKDSDEAVSGITVWLKTVGDSAGAQAVEKAALARYPDGAFARESRWWSLLFTERDPVKRVEHIRQYLNDHPHLEKNELRLMMVSLYTSYQEAKEYDQAAETLSKIENASWQWYNQLAWGLIAKGENLEKATGWAQAGVALSRHPDPDDKRFYATLSEWESACKHNTGAILDTYAYGLFQLAKYDEAERSSAEAFDLTSGNEPEISRRYIDCMIKNNHLEKAIEVGLQCFKQGKSNEKISSMLRQAYAMKEGESAGFDKLSVEKKKKFDEMFAQASQSRADQIRKDVKASRTSKPSVDFTLNSLEGKPVSFASLKGKVVVIDFWATWCGPCKASFPYLQKVYDKYKDNQKVAFLVVDTWEHVQGVPATVENARKFLNDNNYTFPVLIDELTGKRIAEKYAVTGIPTKFIIDKKGNIAFTGVGFAGPEMEQELTAQIELLLGDSM